MPARTLYQKLVDTHTVARLDDQNVLLYADLHLMNEYTSPQAFAGLHEQGRGVSAPKQNVAVVSHIIPTHAVQPRVIADRASALQATNLRDNCQRSEEHTSELQSLMRISYAVFCLKKKNKTKKHTKRN